MIIAVFLPDKTALLTQKEKKQYIGNGVCNMVTQLYVLQWSVVHSWATEESKDGI